jgi:hypothetical protein
MSTYIEAEVRDICAEQIQTILGRGNAELYYSGMARRWWLDINGPHGWTRDAVPGQVVRWMKRKGLLVPNALGTRLVLPEQTP